LLKKITGRYDIYLFVNKKLFNNEDPIINRDDYNYISCEDLSKITNIKTLSSSNNKIEGAIVVSDKYYIPIRCLKDFYNICWDGESGVLDLTSIKNNSESI
jgi:hypothetical protein